MSLTKSWKKPTPDQVTRVIALLAHPQQRYYFFNRLENPEWILEFKERDWFKYPPSVTQNENSAISFPNWPESRYLARMATHRPEEVLSIALDIETDNPSVHTDFIVAALSMPPDVAIKLRPKVEKWIKNSSYLFYDPLADEVGNLVSYLARNNQVKAAIQIARELLQVYPDSRTDQYQGQNRNRYFFPKPRTRVNQYIYNHILKKNIPDLVAADAEQALMLICDLIKDSIEFSGYSSEQQRNEFIWEDNSKIWRALIEDSSQNFGSQDLQNSLVSTLRDAAQQILTIDQSQTSKIASFLINKGWKWRIFHRLYIYLIHKYSENSQSLMSEILVNPNYFDYPRFHQDYEYALLLSEQFPSLPQEDQETILGWISNPDLEQSKADDPEEYQKWVKRWQIRKLAPLKSHLSKEWQEKYSALANDVGGFEIDDLRSSGFQVSIGHRSPKTVAQLSAMSIDELIDYFKSWQSDYEKKSEAEDMFAKPSQKGLAWSLQQLVELEPYRYATVANEFKNLSAIYITHFLQGLRKILNHEKPYENMELFPWSPVLDLCQWVIEESHPTRTPETASQVLNAGWREARRTIADIIGLGVSAEENLAIPLGLRESLWSVLTPLTSDPDPTQDYELEHFNTDKDISAANLAINTVRGEAIHSVIRYALWLRRSQKLLDFDKMPEIRQVLQEHLDPNLDASLAIRSTYGQWFPWLALLDENWIIQNISGIFPHQAELKMFWEAAWNSYIVLCSPYDNAFNLLADEYKHAIEQISSEADIRPGYLDRDKSLAHHLMTYYWRGKISLNNSDLLVKFYDVAPIALHKEALEFVGRSLHNTKEDIDSDIQERLIALWEFRLSIIQNTMQLGTDPDELSAYGWWFASAKLEPTWSISQLKLVLEIVDYIEADNLVVERLAELAETHLKLVLECLQMIVEKNKTEWRVYGWDDEARRILVLALQSKSTNHQNTAKAIIDCLGRRGYWKFREILRLLES